MIGKRKTLTSWARRCSRTSELYRRDARPRPRQVGRNLERIELRGSKDRGAMREIDAGQRDPIRDRDPHPFADARGDIGWRTTGQVRVGRDRAEMALDHRERRGRLEVTGDGEDGVVGRVPGREEAANVVERGGAQVLHRSDRRVVVWVRVGVDKRLHPLIPVAVRLVVDRPAPLVLHHLALVVELLLGHRRQQAGQPVGLEPQGQLQLVAGQRLEVVGAVEPGRCVEGAAGSLHERHVLALLDVQRPLEHHVLEQVGEAGLARLLVPAAHVVPQVYGHDRGTVVRRQEDAQTVFQRVTVDRD